MSSQLLHEKNRAMGLDLGPHRAGCTEGLAGFLFFLFLFWGSSCAQGSFLAGWGGGSLGYRDAPPTVLSLRPRLPLHAYLLRIQERSILVF